MARAACHRELALAQTHLPSASGGREPLDCACDLLKGHLPMSRFGYRARETRGLRPRCFTQPPVHLR